MTCKVFHKAKSELAVRVVVSAVYPGTGCYGWISASLQTQTLNSLQNVSRPSSKRCDKPHTADLLFNMLTFTYDCRRCICLHSPSKISPKCKFLRWLVLSCKGKFFIAGSLRDCLPYLVSLEGENYASTAYLQLPLILDVTEGALNCEETWSLAPLI